MILHKLGIEAIIGYEIGAERPGDLRMYNRKYGFPTVPSNASGVTIGIGYDLGMNSVAQIRADWEGKVNSNALLYFLRCTRLTGDKARATIKANTRFFVPYSAANEVFVTRTLPRFCKETIESFPAIEKLNPLAQSVIVSIVFNRGKGLVDTSTNAQKEQRRKEMRNLVGAIEKVNYTAIANEIKKMKRLWDGVPDFEGDVEQRLEGLLKRRDAEAAMILSSVNMKFDNKDLITVSTD